MLSRSHLEHADDEVFVSIVLIYYQSFDTSARLDSFS